MLRLVFPPLSFVLSARWSPGWLASGCWGEEVVALTPAAGKENLAQFYLLSPAKETRWMEEEGKGWGGWRGECCDLTY